MVQSGFVRVVKDCNVNTLVLLDDMKGGLPPSPLPTPPSTPVCIQKARGGSDLSKSGM